MTLAHLGLHAGEEVRFRRLDRGRWQRGIVRRLETDGSIGVVDGSGAIRSIRVTDIEVRAAGPRGASLWEPLESRAGRTEQLDLLG